MVSTLNDLQWHWGIEYLDEFELSSTSNLVHFINIEIYLKIVPNQSSLELLAFVLVINKHTYEVYILNILNYWNWHSCKNKCLLSLCRRLMELSTQQEEKEHNESAAQRMGDIDMRYLTTLLQHIIPLLW